MFNSNRFSFPMALAVAAAIPLFACSSSGLPGSGALCCTEFAVGGTVDVKIGGSAQSQIAVQAIADIGGVAAAAVADVTAACQGIATDLGADTAKATDADSKTDANDRMNAWCALASAQIDATLMASASAKLVVDITPAQCSASLTATADCQGSCDVNAKCNIKATPPVCEGPSAKLEIDCKGDCTAKAGAELDCTGTCDANCKGDCSASGGVAVDCTGKCDGTCTAKAGVGDGMGAHADGTCAGTCSGTCHATATAPAIKCSGSCKGTCTGTCKGTAMASVQCSGTCDPKADYTPLSCTGGKLSGGCMVDAKCQASCNASVSAKASCTPPTIKVSFTGAASLDGLAKLQATLEANLPKIFEIKTKFELLGDAVGAVSGNASALTDIKLACIPAVAAAGVQAAKDVTGTISASATITGKVGG